MTRRSIEHFGKIKINVPAAGVGLLATGSHLLALLFAVRLQRAGVNGTELRVTTDLSSQQYLPIVLR